MHSLLFAALETFSLILLRKKNIQKRKRVITFSDYLLCESANSATHGVTVWSSTSFTQFQIMYCICLFYFVCSIFEGFQLSSHHPCAVPVYPGLQYCDLLQIIVLKLFLFSFGAWVEGRSATFWVGSVKRALRHPLFQSGLLWLHPFGPMQPGRPPKCIWGALSEALTGSRRPAEASISCCIVHY